MPKGDEKKTIRCSFCGKWALETKPGLMEQVEDGTLRIEWRDFPVFGNESVDLAVAARAAAQQGLFWEYNEAIFTYQFEENNQDFTAEALTALAERVGVPDLEAFAADLAKAIATYAHGTVSTVGRVLHIHCL